MLMISHKKMLLAYVGLVMRLQSIGEIREAQKPCTCSYLVLHV